MVDYGRTETPLGQNGQEVPNGHFLTSIIAFHDHFRVRIYSKTVLFLLKTVQKEQITGAERPSQNSAVKNGQNGHSGHSEHSCLAAHSLRL